MSGDTSGDIREVVEVPPGRSFTTPSEIVNRYTPLLERLKLPQRILQSRLSPTDADEPGDYRSFTVSGTILVSNICLVPIYSSLA